MSAHPGLVVIEHEIDVPVDHTAPSGPTLTVFAREVRRPDDPADRPALVYLEGGPGGESPRPTGAPFSPPWLERALCEYRVILLDQRGTGRSTPITAMSDQTPQEQAVYLAHFRADSIVADCEMLRQGLGIERWSLLGQSFGGFCAFTYLSRHPDSLREVMISGGVPQIGIPVDDVYRGTFPRTLELVERHYRRFPNDRDRMAALVDLCDDGRIRLPHGGLLSSRRLRSIGAPLGMTGGSERIHYLLERDPLGLGFGHEVAALLPFSAAAPLYTLVQEACYADGQTTNWAGARMQPTSYDDDPTLMTAEHVFPWMLTEDPVMASFAEAADILAKRPWPALYDRDVLKANEVPVSAIIYYDDPYVLREQSLSTVDLMPSLRPWITNEHLHNGLHLAGEAVLDRLIWMTKMEVSRLGA